jgi:hypothetical protein
MTTLAYRSTDRMLRDVPAVRETLGRISAQEAMIAGMVNGQINAFEGWPGG